MPKERRACHVVEVGTVSIGHGHDVVVQSMTDTQTRNVDSTVHQILALHGAGSELVRIAVQDLQDAEAVPEIRARLDAEGCHVPLVGDFHFIAHSLLQDAPACARTLDKYRINPGNIGFGQRHDAQFAQVLDIAGAHGKPIRIGANWGSIDEEVRSRLMREHPEWSFDQVLEEAMVTSVLESLEFALRRGFPANRIVLSAKVSDESSLIAIYRRLAKETDCPLHLGLTESGTGVPGIISTTAALSALLQEGIGDTIRVSLTPRKPTSELPEPRTEEVTVAQRILQANGLRSFYPIVRSCPGCGRTQRSVFQDIVRTVTAYVETHQRDWRSEYPRSAGLTIAVMGCVVNGFEEGKHANLGISLPGSREDQSLAHIFKDGQELGVVRLDAWEDRFLSMIEDYITKSS